jgi:hypothetical protein
MDNILNKNLYEKAKKEADKIYKRHGLYKSAFIQKKYKELGGKYKDEKTSNKKGINRWLKEEQWVEVLPYLNNGKKIVCGTSEGGKACRPLIRYNDKTPITLPELIKLHGKEKLKKLVKEKIKDMDKRINWKKGTIS